MKVFSNCARQFGWSAVLLSSFLQGQGLDWQLFDMSNAAFPSNTVKAIACDAQGIVWVATDWGLCRQETGVWSVWQDTNSGLPENNLRALAVDTANNLWVGTTLYGVAVFDGTAWTYFDVDNSPLPENEINCITIDHRGWAWIGTTAGLACYTGTEWRVYNDSPSSYNGLILNGNNIKSVAVGLDGLVAMGTLNGGFHYITDTLVSVNATYINSFPDNTATGVVIDEVAGERWLACPAGGLLRQGGPYIGGPWFQYAPWNSSIPSASLTCLARDDQGGLWMGSTLNGLITRTPAGDHLSWNTGNSDLPDDHVLCTAIAPDGAIWVGTYQGGAARAAATASVEPVPSAAIDLRVWPNPVEDRVHVELPGTGSDGHWSWRILDVQGRCVGVGGFAPSGSRILDLTGCNPGIFILSLESKNGRVLWARIIKR